MSTSSSRRLLTGLATAAVTLGLVALPVVASADPTPSPDPTTETQPAASTAATPSTAPTREAPSPSAPPSSASPTESMSPATSPTPSESASPSSSESPSPSAPEESSSPSHEDPTSTPTAAARVAADALAMPGPTASAAAPEQAVQAVAGASIALSKAVSPSRVSRVGQVVTYTFRATNNGTVPLTDVGITDELEGLRTTCPSAGASLAAGAVLSCTATLTVTQAALDFGDIYNFATVFGSYPVEESEEIDYVGANAAARVVVDQSPSISLRASVSPTGTADRGDRLRYTGTATNTGNVTLTAARITSSLRALDLDCEPSARATLAPGASISCSGSYRVTAADARRGRVSTELTARAEPPFGQTTTSSDDVTDGVRLRVAVTKPPASRSVDHGLADTGGPALPLAVGGLAAVAGGLVLLRRTRRS